MNFLFYQAHDVADGIYFIQSQLKQNSCVEFSWLGYDADAEFCQTPCNPATNSECANWPAAWLGRAEIKQVSVNDKKEFKLNKRAGLNTQFMVPCYYYTIETFAVTGCMANKPYWMSFMDTTITSQNTGASHDKWHLLPITTTLADKKLAAFLLKGLDNSLICTSSSYVR